jgi:hypothetical protein
MTRTNKIEQVLKSLNTWRLSEFIEENGDNTWGLFGHPEKVMPNRDDSEIYCRYKDSEWIHYYTEEQALDDLMFYYQHYKKNDKNENNNLQNKISEWINKPTALRCHIAKILAMDFSKDPFIIIKNLEEILSGYSKIVAQRKTSTGSKIDNVMADKEYLKWIFGELLPVLYFWMGQLNVLRASKPVYEDSVLNYITKIFLLCQAKEFFARAEKQVITAQSTARVYTKMKSKGLELNYIVNQLREKWTDIDVRIERVIRNVEEDTFLTPDKRNAILAASYDLLSRTDKVMTNLRLKYHLISSYKWLIKKVNTHCKMIRHTVENTSTDYVNKRVCTFLGQYTRKPITPRSITKNFGDKKKIVSIDDYHGDPKIAKMAWISSPLASPHILQTELSSSRIIDLMTPRKTDTNLNNTIRAYVPVNRSDSITKVENESSTSENTSSSEVTPRQMISPINSPRQTTSSVNLSRLGIPPPPLPVRPIVSPINSPRQNSNLNQNIPGRPRKLTPFVTTLTTPRIPILNRVNTPLNRTPPSHVSLSHEYDDGQFISSPLNNYNGYNEYTL